MTVESIFFEKRESNIVTYESSTANIQVGCLAGGDPWKFLWKTWKSYLFKSVSPDINHWFVDSIIQYKESEKHQQKVCNVENDIETTWRQ